MTAPIFIPTMQIVTNVTNAQQAVVTTANPHGYATGDVIQLFVPNDYGMSIYYVETKITITGLNTFTTTLDTFFSDVFVIPVIQPFTPAQCCNVTGTTVNIAV